VRHEVSALGTERGRPELVIVAVAQSRGRLRHRSLVTPGLLVTIVGSRVTTGSATAFRWAWAVAAALSVATAVVGLALTRARPAEEPAAPAESEGPAASALAEPARPVVQRARIEGVSAPHPPG
jgi:hypothetical protein